MHSQSITTVVAGGWLVAVFFVAMFYGVTSVSGLALLAGLALLSLLGMLWLWNTPRESMSEAIQKALR